MEQFGVHMNFLWNIQVSSNYLFTKNPFLFYFSDFRADWTRPRIPETTGFNVQKFLTQTQPTQDCGLISVLVRVSYAKG